MDKGGRVDADTIGSLSQVFIFVFYFYSVYIFRTQNLATKCHTVEGALQKNMRALQELEDYANVAMLRLPKEKCIIYITPQDGPGGCRHYSHHYLKQLLAVCLPFPIYLHLNLFRMSFLSGIVTLGAYFTRSTLSQRSFSLHIYLHLNPDAFELQFVSLLVPFIAYKSYMQRTGDE